MKKVALISAIVLLIAVCLVALTGCGAIKMEGKYGLISAKMEGVVIEGEGLKTAGLDAMFIEFVNDATFKMGVMGETTEGTYTVDGNTLTMTVDGESVEATIDGKQIVMEQEGASMTFEKQ